MRTTIEIDDELLAAAMAATGLPTRRATVEEGSRLIVQLRGRIEALDDLAGIGWDDRRTLHAGNAESGIDDEPE